MRLSHPTVRVGIAFAVIVSVSACMLHRSAAAVAPAPPSAPMQLTNANLAAMLLAANNTDISYARLAPARAEREDVKKFAERMLADHSSANQQATQLFAQLGIVAEDNIASLDMRDESATKRDILDALSGHAFDSTYMDNEVTYHTKLLATLDTVMIPAAHTVEMRNFLIAVRDVVASHLAHAKIVRAAVMAHGE